MSPNRHASFVLDFPSELEIVTTRSFDAPVELVFDVLTKPEHLRNWMAAWDDRMTVCDVDFRVGGEYHYVAVTPDGMECSFRGTYLEIEPPLRTVATWWFEGWGPDLGVVETTELSETDGVTTMTASMVFSTAEGRAHLTKHDGQEDSYNKLEDYLRSLLDGGVA